MCISEEELDFILHIILFCFGCSRYLVKIYWSIKNSYNLNYECIRSVSFYLLIIITCNIVYFLHFKNSFIKKLKTVLWGWLWFFEVDIKNDWRLDLERDPPVFQY